LILVDTSAWIDFFRARAPLSEEVDELLDANEAAVCGPVLTELRRGLRSSADRRRVIPLLGGCRHLEQPARLWEEAGDLGYLLARRGVTVTTQGLLIASYALAHGVAILAADSDFAAMRNAGIPIAIVV
jgi:hypothetical protein